LIKSSQDGWYEPFPSEGGHVDFTVKSEEDWELFKFAQKYIENSDNIENKRAKMKVGRMSVERLCAGPAVPLIYQFMKEKYSNLEVILEKDSKYGKAKHFNDIESKDIIMMAT
jgi:glucokinase